MRSHAHFGRNNVVAEFPDMERARHAIDALQFAGIDAVDISLLGEKAIEAEEKTSSMPDTAPVDAPIALHVLRRAALWGLIGLVGGGILGTLLGIVGINFSPVGDSVAVQTLSWALLGVLVGSLVGGYSGLSISEDWDLTFAPVDDGEFQVAVHSDDPREVERAKAILRKQNALHISKFDQEGHPV